MTSWERGGTTALIAATIAVVMSSPVHAGPANRVMHPLETPAPVQPGGGGFGLVPGVDVGSVTAGGPVDQMGNGVVGARCDSWVRYIFGRDPGGAPIACVTFDGQAGTWIPSAPLYGIQPVGAPCDVAGRGAAQSPDGLGLVCRGVWLPG